MAVAGYLYLRGICNLSNTIEITTAIPADQQEWDSFVLACPGASPYHLFAWSTAIKQAYGHEIHPLMARQNDKLVGVLPLIHLKLVLFLNELVALPFCDVGSCLSANSIVEEKLLVEAIKLGNQLKINNIQLRGQLQSKDNANSSFTQLKSSKVRMMLNLPDSSDALLKEFKSKLRSQVRKAENNGIAFRWVGKEGVDSFYSVFCTNMRDLGSPVHSKKLFQAIMKYFGKNGRIGLAEFEGKCIGAGLILSTNEQTAVPWASTLRQYNHLAPNMLLYWNFLKFAADNGNKVFDFGRSTEDEGTYRFKKQWGAKPVPLSWYATHLDIQAHYEENKTNPTRREKVAEIWKKIPLPIANFLGPQLRKYINL